MKMTMVKSSLKGLIRWNICVNHGDQRFSSIWNHHKCLRSFFLIHLYTYFMGLRPLEMFYSLSEGIDLSDVYILQILMSKDSPLAEIKGLIYSRFGTFYLYYIVWRKKWRTLRSIIYLQINILEEHLSCLYDLWAYNILMPLVVAQVCISHCKFFDTLLSSLSLCVIIFKKEHTEIYVIVWHLTCRGLRQWACYEIIQQRSWS